MSLATANLPADPDELRAFAALLQSELYAKTLHIEKLKAQLAALRRARFGQSSEKLDRQIEQLELMIGDLEEGEAENEARAAATTPARSPARTPREGNREAAARASAAGDRPASRRLRVPGLRFAAAAQDRR